MQYVLANRDKHALQIHLIVKISNDDIDAISTVEKKSAEGSGWLNEVEYTRYLFDCESSKNFS